MDFSDHSGVAAEWAAMIALRTNATLYLLHKFLVSDSETVKAGKPDDLFSAAEREARMKLQALKERLCRKFRPDELNCDIQTVYGIELDDIIVNSAKDLKADLIVMATEGAEKLTDILFGSNTTHVINKARIPVLVIPEDTAVKLPETIVYATDLKNEDSRLISFVLDLASSIGSKVIFLHINNKNTQELDRLKAEISKWVESAGEAGAKVPVSYDEIKSENVFDALRGYSEKKHAGLIVLGNHQKNFFQKLTEGDFSRLMALYSFIPSLVLQKD